MMVPAEAALADEYSETVELFRNAGESAALFTNSYGYAVFPTIGKAGLVVGGAHGTGRVYAHGKYVGDTSMTQVRDRKSTRLNSSHLVISYAVFCLKKKK